MDAAATPSLAIDRLVDALMQPNGCPDPERALATLREALVPFGWAGAAALAAAPRIADLVVARVPPRAGLLVLAADLAAGGAHANLLMLGHSTPPEGSDLATIWRGLAPVVAVATEALADPDPAVRAAAVLPVAVIAGDAAALRRAIAAETRCTPLATALAALGWLEGPRRTDPGDVALVHRFAAHASGRVRLAARLADVLVGGAAGDARALADEARAAKGRNVGVPWNDGRLRPLALHVAAKALADARDVDGVLALAGDVPDEHVLAFALVALLPRGAEPPALPLAAGDLSDHQAAGLRAVLARFPGVDRRIRDEIVRAHGLVMPDRLLGLAPSGALDRMPRASGEPLWRVARRVRDGHLPWAAWAEAIADEGPTCRAEIAADLASGAYALASAWPPRATDDDARAAEVALLDRLILDTLADVPAACIAPWLERIEWHHRICAFTAGFVRALERAGAVPEPAHAAIFDEALAQDDADPALHATIRAARAKATDRLPSLSGA